MTAGAEPLPSGRWRHAGETIDERLGLSGLAYPVPAHANGIGYILGAVADHRRERPRLTGLVHNISTMALAAGDKCCRTLR